MRRLLARVLHVVRSAWTGLAGSPVTSAVAIATLAGTLFLVGALALLLRNMQGVLDRVGSDVRVTAYLDRALDEDARDALAGRVGAVAGVEGVEIVSAEEALRRFQAGIGGRSGLLEGLDENPLPPSLEITIESASRTTEGLGRVESAIAGMPGVQEVSSGRDWVEGYVRAVDLLRTAGLVLGAILALAALLIVANTIRLAVYARRDEIEILSLVGASRSFIGLPFLLEGALQGAVGGLLALGLLFGLFHFAAPAFATQVELVLGSAEPVFLSGADMAKLVGGGAALGLLGSALSLIGGWPR